MAIRDADFPNLLRHVLVMNVPRWSAMPPQAQESAWRLVVVMLFAAYFAIGLLTYADYGMSTDEAIQRQHGLVSLKYILSLLGIDAAGDFAYLARMPDLATYPHRSYGVVFHLPLLLIEHVLRDRLAINELWQVRHLYTFLWFFVGTVFFFRLARFWLSWPLSIIATLLFVSSPRIYADSFYNVKDTTFLACFNVALFYGVSFMKQVDQRGALKFAMAVAVMLNVRFFGLFLPAFVGCLMLLQVLRQPRQGWATSVMPLVTLAVASVAFTWMIWPAAWSDPLRFFIDTFILSTNYDRYTGVVLYMGVRYPGSELPWHYIPHWVLISTPLHHLLLLAATALGLPWIWRSSRLAEMRMPTVLLFMVLLAPPALAILFKSTLNTNWRHFYFLQAPLALLAPLSLQYLWDRSREQVGRPVIRTTVIALLLGATLAGLSYQVGWLYRYHPHQQVFFNWFGLRQAQTGFQLDGWNLSARHGIEHIVTIDSRPSLLVHSYVVEKQFLLLDAEVRRRLKFSRYAENADFIVDTNHWSRTHPPSTGRWENVYELKVDGLVIMRIWKRLADESFRD